MSPQRFQADWLSLADSFWQIARYILEDDAEAEDAVQDLYLKLWKNREALEGIGNPKGYGITVLRNICLDRIRKRRKSVAAGSEAQEAEVPGNYDETIDAKERLAKVLDAIKSLPDRQRTVLIMRTVEGLSYEDISRRTGIPYLNLRVLLSQARRKLKNKAQ